MNQYRVWVRLNDTQTANVIVYADNDYLAKLIAEAQFGVGNVLAYTRME